MQFKGFSYIYIKTHFLRHTTSGMLCKKDSKDL